MCLVINQIMIWWLFVKGLESTIIRGILFMGVRYNYKLTFNIFYLNMVVDQRLLNIYSMVKIKNWGILSMLNCGKTSLHMNKFEFLITQRTPINNWSSTS